ncbi:hypothetical protein P154DRAFT_498811 [Amniculicola lignicola CBS 123094]|uniref:Uncharacterized protein n=1 Tax=Amniculicola lignicola CBS 123094 TaxID=1392246 RepID=A0A6A5WF09_9PLEO|nr:hypothetical protein P154DRAFT_498811 [Amniculicola lignicola CBS 123094]
MLPRMRNVLFSSLLLSTSALAAPDLLADFLTPESLTPQSNDTLIAEGTLELVKRQGCAVGYNACSNLGAPGLCCRSNAICSADAAGHVACCPQGAACTGTIAGVAGPSAAMSTGTATTNPFVVVTTTTATGSQPSFVQSGGAQGTRSTVDNPYFPIAYIPTTYTNAAACSSAYSSCQTDAASCTAALANGLPGVTITAPNGGATITAIASLGMPSAVAICSSLSLQACYNLDVAACANFGNGNTGAAATRGCGGLYGLGAGVAVGIAGQLLR